MQNKLPKEGFAIKWTDDPRWMEYIKWLNDAYNINTAGKEMKFLYGVNYKRQMKICNLISLFGFNAVELTLDQFFELIKEEEVKEEVIDYDFEYIGVGHYIFNFQDKTFECGKYKLVKID